MLRPVGWVRSAVAERGLAARQGDEGAPDAWLEFAPEVARAMADLRPGHRIVVLTWLDRADRDVLAVHPRSDPDRPLTGVFNTRSPDRPNPDGLHPVTVLAVDGSRVKVDRMEALDGTPILDVKPHLAPAAER